MTGPRIHITGASGAGVSTLGRALAHEIGGAWFDVDDYYWVDTDPPFQEKRPISERVRRLAAALAAPRWVLSGSVGDWGDDLIRCASLVIYLDTATPIRLARLGAREQNRFGARIAPGGDMHSQHLAFLDWAAAYDRGDQAGRSRLRHEAWLAGLQIPVLRLDGAQATETLVRRIAAATTLRSAWSPSCS
jgi:adenylate kinase family enzyme